MADKALDLAAAKVDKSHLQPFDGKPVVQTTISVSNAGDGLSNALAIEPQEFHHGDRVFVVIEGEIDRVTHSPLSKDVPNMLVREHRLKAGTSTIVEGSLVAEVLEAQAAKIAAARLEAETEQRRAKGEYTLDDQAAIAEHEDGQHPELREGCPLCDAERAAAAGEAAGDDETPDNVQPIGGRKRASRAKKATKRT